MLDHTHALEPTVDAPHNNAHPAAYSIGSPSIVRGERADYLGRSSHAP